MTSWRQNQGREPFQPSLKGSKLIKWPHQSAHCRPAPTLHSLCSPRGDQINGIDCKGRALFPQITPASKTNKPFQKTILQLVSSISPGGSLAKSLLGAEQIPAREKGKERIQLTEVTRGYVWSSSLYVSLVRSVAEVNRESGTRF